MFFLTLMLSCVNKNPEIYTISSQDHSNETALMSMTAYDFMKLSRQRTDLYCKDQYFSKWVPICAQGPQANPSSVFLDDIYSVETMQYLPASKLIVSAKNITVEQIQNLPQYKISELYFDQVENVEPKLAQAMVSNRKVISLNGITSISDEVLQILVSMPYGSLYLDGLTTLSDSQMDIIRSGKVSRLSLNGLRILPTELLKNPGNSLNSLSLDGINELQLPDFDQRSLNYGLYDELSLGGLKDISLNDLNILVKLVNGILSLNGLHQLRPEYAETFIVKDSNNCSILSRGLELNGVSTLDMTTLDAFYKVIHEHNVMQKGCAAFTNLSFNGLKSISPESISVLIKLLGIDGALSLGGLESLDVESAKALAFGFEKFIRLTGLKEISYPVGMEMGQIKGTISIDNPEIINPNVIAHFGDASRLLVYENDQLAYRIPPSYNFEIYLRNLQRIEPEVAQLWTNLALDEVYFDSLDELHPEVASALSKSKIYELSFGGLSSLNLQSAKELANFDGNLQLSGIENITGEMATVFSRSNRKLTFLDSKSISIDAAKVLSQYPQKIVEFSAIAKLDQSVAVELFSCQTEECPRFYFPHLSEVDESTLNLIREKKNAGMDIEVRKLYRLLNNFER